jgi:hypothetical protein
MWELQLDGRIEDNVSACIIFLEIRLGKRPTGRPRKRWNLAFSMLRVLGGWISLRVGSNGGLS